jgi:hypothetical protein
MRNQESPDDGIRQRLHRLVEERSQSEIARKTGAQVAAVNRYVHGARIPAGFCSDLVRGLGVNPAWLLMGEGSQLIADVPVETARLGENLLELVEAMSAVSRMLLGSLTGKDNRKVLRQLNEALLAHERLRDDLNERSRPVFERILADLQKALDALDLERARDLRKAADQIARLCDDEDLTRRYLRTCAFHEFQLKRSDRFLDAQRKVFLRSLPDGSLFSEQACDEARRIVVALVQMNRIREAGRICRAVRALAGKEGRNWPAWARLENTYSVILAETGHLRKAIDQMQRAIPRLDGMYRKVSEAALVRLLLLAGILTIREAAGMGTNTDAKASHFLQFAVWDLDQDNLEFAIEYAARPDVEHVWGPGFHHMMARRMLGQLRRPSPRAAREFEAEFRQAVPDADADTLNFTLAQARCELNRIGGYRKEAIKDLQSAEAERKRLAPELVPTPLELATHYRSALILLAEAKSAADKRLHIRARRWFRKRLKQGYLCFEGVVKPPA